MKSYNVTIELDDVMLPYETALIEGLILNGTLGNFLYLVANDVVEERYNIDAGHTQIILDQIISTVGSIFETVSSMDENISDITKSLNTHTDLLGKLKEITPLINQVENNNYKNGKSSNTLSIEEKDLDLGIVEEPEDNSPPPVELDVDEELEGDLEMTDDFVDLFDLQMDS